MRGFQLYEDQAEFVVKLREALREGHRSVLGVASPAFGKTVVAGHIISQARQKSNASAWFLVHRKNLLRQTSKSFWSAHIEHGLMTSGKRRSTLPVQVGIIGTVFARHKELKAPAILFVDEAHLAKGRMFETVINWARENGSIVIGLTGTPRRLDGKPLGDLFTCLIEAKSPAWLIQQGRLSGYEIYSTRNMPDFSSVRKKGGDLDTEQMAEIMGSRAIVGDAIAHWRKYANGLRTIVYCCNVKHSKQTAAAFNAAGIPAVHVDGDTTEAELKDACEGLATGRYKVMTNCELVIEGFDLSAQVGMDVTLECCILLRKTLSLARYLQMVFRVLRKKPNKAVILDHAGCVMLHGLPDDDHEWSLEGEEKKARKRGDDEEPDVNVSQCLQCFAIFRRGPSECPSCGEPLPGSRQAEIEVIEGELVKVDVEAVRREMRKEQGEARDLRSLISLGIRRDMKNPSGWAANVYAARQGQRPTPALYKTARDIMSQLKGVQA